jgi:hypothetical protein
MLRREEVPMPNRLLLSFITVGVMVVAAASNTYRVHIYQDSVINGKSIKAGDYKVALENNMAVLKQGKQTVEVPAHAESAPSKFASTEIEYSNNALQEIHIGGSRTKIVFSGAGATAGGAE